MGQTTPIARTICTMVESFQRIRVMPDTRRYLCASLRTYHSFRCSRGTCCCSESSSLPPPIQLLPCVLSRQPSDQRSSLTSSRESVHTLRPHEETAAPFLNCGLRTSGPRPPKRVASQPENALARRRWTAFHTTPSPAPALPISPCPPITSCPQQLHSNTERLHRALRGCGWPPAVPVLRLCDIPFPNWLGHLLLELR